MWLDRGGLTNVFGVLHQNRAVSHEYDFCPLLTHDERKRNKHEFLFLKLVSGGFIRRFYTFVSGISLIFIVGLHDSASGIDPIARGTS